MAATCLRCGKDIAISGGSLLCADCLEAQARVSATAGLIAINSLVFILMVVTGVSAFAPTAEDLLRWGASYGPYDLGSGWWRLFTSMFVHIGIIHIALNMYCLASLGPVAEAVLGGTRFLTLYLLSGLAGAIASAGVHPQIVSAGASGAIFGVAGALAAVIYVRRDPLMEGARGRLSKVGIGTFVVYNLIYGTANAGIDNAAHVGGLIAGFLMGWTLPVGPQAAAEPERPLRTGFVFAAAVVALAGGFLGVRQLRHDATDLETARQDLIGGRLAEGTDRLEQLVRTSPNDAQAHMLLGAAYLDQHRTTDAVRELQTALHQHPGDTLVLELLASAHIELKQWEQAVAILRQQTFLARRNAAAWTNLGAVFLDWGRPMDAAEALKQARQLSPDAPNISYLLGVAYSRAEKCELALPAFDSALALAPGNSYALLDRGHCHLRLKHEARARADFQAILAAPPGAVEASIRQQASSYLAGLGRQ